MAQQECKDYEVDEDLSLLVVLFSDKEKEIDEGGRQRESR
jgi:hypothetical protein